MELGDGNGCWDKISRFRESGCLIVNKLSSRSGSNVVSTEFLSCVLPFAEIFQVHPTGEGTQRMEEQKQIDTKALPSKFLPEN